MTFIEALIRAEALLAEIRDNADRQDWKDEANLVQPELLAWLDEQKIGSVRI